MDDVNAFTALANPVRREILQRLRDRPHTAGELAAGFGIGRPAVSEHLQVLRRARLVWDEPRGRERHYHLDARPLEDVALWLRAFTQYWEGRLSALGSVLDEENGDTR